MEKKTMKDNSEKILYTENVVCNGCNEEFCTTVRSDPDNEDTKYCGNCFAHIVGLKEFSQVLKKLSPVLQVIWQTPTNKLSNETKKRIEFVDKSRNVQR